VTCERHRTTMDAALHPNVPEHLGTGGCDAFPAVSWSPHRCR
jgi:hypothetical protein